MINKGESNRKLRKMFPGKNLQMTQKKASLADLIKKISDVVRSKQMRAQLQNTKAFYYGLIQVRDAVIIKY